MNVATTAGSGRRSIYNAELMADRYDPPGVEFVPSENHEHATDHPVAECPQEIGEALCEDYAVFVPLDDVLDESDTGDTGDSESENSESESGDENSESDGSAPGVGRSIENADYSTLQQVGGELASVDGSAATDDLREQLHSADTDAVRDAFATVSENAADGGE